jgi:hypothetical protein
VFIVLYAMEWKKVSAELAGDRTPSMLSSIPSTSRHGLTPCSLSRCLQALRYFLTCVIFALLVPWVYFA